MQYKGSVFFILGALAFLFSAAFAAPSISFPSPTPTDGQAIGNTSATIDVLVGESNLANFTLNWNGTNYSFYDPTLVGMWNFDDVNYNDDFSQSQVNLSRWVIDPSCSISSGRLYCNTSTSNFDFGAVKSNGLWYLKGDFDIQVDFDASGWGTPTSGTGWQATLEARRTGTGQAMACFYSKWSDGSKVYYSYDDSLGNSFGTLSTTATSGKLRMVRTGTTVSCYYWTGSAFTQYATRTAADVANDAYTAIYILNRDSGQAVNGYFDNFIVNKGQQVADNSRSANQGAVKNSGWSFVSGKYGNAIQLNGVNGAGVDVPNAASLQFGTSNVTFEAWVKPQAYAPDGWDDEIITKLNISAVRTGYMLAMRGASAGGLANKTMAFFGYGGAGDIEPSGTTNINNNQWRHLVASFNRNGNLTIYENGIATSAQDISAYPGVNTSTAFDLGIGFNPDTSFADRVFNGSIDNVRVYKRALTAAEARMAYISNFRKVNSTHWEVTVALANLTDGNYTYYAFAQNSTGGLATTAPATFQIHTAPFVANFTGDTTNFAAITDLTNVTNLTLDKPGTGRIKFPATYSVNALGQDYDTNVKMGAGYISVNSSALDQSFNTSASLTMNLTGFYSNSLAPDIYYYSGFLANASSIVQAGTLCVSPRCTGISWDSAGKILTFNVTGFSDYGINGSGGFGGASNGTTYENTGTLGINITSTNQIAVYTSNGMNDSTFSFVPVTPPAAGSITLMSNETSNTTGGELGFLVENQGNVNVSITVASDKDAASFIGGSAPLFQMFGGVNETGACPSINASMQSLSGSAITVCPSLAYADSQDTIWAYVLVKIDSDSPPQTSTATLTFTSTQV
ncbi:MAG: LamG domain-containing protein [Candidatus Micrarchaeia archaeon]